MFIVSVALVALAELGDKTQLLTLCLAARYRAWQVLVGVFGAVVLLQLLAVAAGRLVGEALPETPVRIAAGLLFVAFGIWMLASRGSDADAPPGTAMGAFGPVLASGIAFFVAELGDKTQLTAMAIAAEPSVATGMLERLGAHGLAAVPASSGGAFLPVWLGATVGMMIADGAAILVGASLGKRIPTRLVGRISGVVFLLFGLATLVSVTTMGAGR